MRYHVIRTAYTVGWSVIREGAARAVRRHPTKWQAVAHGKSLAEKNRGCLYVHLANGLVENRLSYALDATPST